MEKIVPYPEVEIGMEATFGKTSKEILNFFSSPADFENISAENLNRLLEKISELLDKQGSPITAIPGIGATILGEVGDIKRFSTPAKCGHSAHITIVSTSANLCLTFMAWIFYF